MKKFLIFVIPVFLGLFSWWYFRTDTGCAGCAANKDKFFIILSPPGEKMGVEKVAAALKQDYSHFRVIFWSEEVDADLKPYIEKYPYKFEMYNSREKGLMPLYRLVHSIPATDVVVMLSPALNDPQALKKLNQTYKNKKTVKTPESFYAGLFQRIKLEHFMGAAQLAQVMASMPDQLKELPKVKKADLVVFSYDRPLQLYAYLESLEKFVKNVGEVSVILRSSHPDYQKGYEVVKKRFPKVKFLMQGKNSKKDFKDFVLKAAFKTSNSYVMYGVDDIIIRSPIDIEECIGYLEETGAFGFYLCLGKNTDFCNGPRLQGIPPSLPINDSVFAWQFKDGKDDWRYPHTHDMALFRKEEIRKDAETLNYNNPTTFECSWAQKANLNQVGLYYETSKIVNLPLNIVNTPENRYLGNFTAAQLHQKFKAGLKLDIQPLEKFRNCSAHTDFDITFVKRVDE
jgi:hypothetical protein